MIQRFLVMDSVPELRPEPGSPERSLVEMEVALPLEVYWRVRELIEDIKYSKSAGESSTRAWKEFANLILPYIVHERDRIWFIKNVGR
jgi:hypothetical protein